MGSVVSDIFGGGSASPGTPQSGQYDPFQAYRSGYAPQVGTTQDTLTTQSNQASALGISNAAQQQGLASTYNTAMQATTQPGAAISSQMQGLANDPSSLFSSQAGQAYMNQVQQAQQRTAASQGMTSSGNEQLGLQNAMYAGAQGYAGQQMNQYGAALQGAQSVAGLEQGALTSGLSAQTQGLQASTVAGQQQVANTQGLMGNLMQLSGASQSAAQGYSAAMQGYSAMQGAQATNQKGLFGLLGK